MVGVDCATPAVWHVRLHASFVVAGCASGHVLVFSLDERRLRWTLPAAAQTEGAPVVMPAHPGGVAGLAVDTARDILYTGGADRTVKVGTFPPALQRAPH